MLDLTGQVGPLLPNTGAEIAFLVDAGTAGLLQRSQVDHSPDEHKWVSTALRSSQSELTILVVPACYPTILPQAYGTGWGNIDGMLVPSARRCVLCTISTCYAGGIGSNDTLEDT